MKHKITIFFPVKCHFLLFCDVLFSVKQELSFQLVTTCDFVTSKQIVVKDDQLEFIWDDCFTFHETWAWP